MSPASVPRRRLRHRLPVRIRHYWRLLVTCAAFLTTCAVVVSTVRVAPLVISASDGGGDQVTQDIAGTGDLFDARVAHRITVTFHDADYQRMLDEYWDEGEKAFLEADLTVDGTRIPSVGIRLKGNSTLGSLTRNGQSRPGGLGQRRPQGAGKASQAAGTEAPGGFAGGVAPDGVAPDRGAPAGGALPGAAGPGGGLAQTSLKAEEPENLPWLIRFDEFVDGRRYQGHRDISVRIASMGGATTVLNEAVSLDLLTAAGQPAQRYAYTSFTVNDRPTTARLIVQHPDEEFSDTIGDSGVLYKSLAASQFSDQGDDPTEYTDDFKQITMKGSHDLQPVINLVRWVTTSSDTEFNAHLADYIDVPAFARYVAAQNLLLNSDDMSGPGRNYYLWYDLDTKRFTVVGWDYNLTFSGRATQGAHDTTTMGGGFQREAGAAEQGLQLPGGGQLPEGMRQPGGAADGKGAPGGSRVMSGNKLKERFLASSSFTAVYEAAYRSLYQSIYANGTALATLERITKVLSTVDGYDQQGSAATLEQLRTTIRQRAEYLATDAITVSQ
jgi:spore coat protein CotH